MLAKFFPRRKCTWKFINSYPIGRCFKITLNCQANDYIFQSFLGYFASSKLSTEPGGLTVHGVEKLDTTEQAAFKLHLCERFFIKVYLVKKANNCRKCMMRRNWKVFKSFALSLKSVRIRRWSGIFIPLKT